MGGEQKHKPQPAPNLGTSPEPVCYPVDIEEPAPPIPGNGGAPEEAAAVMDNYADDDIPPEWRQAAEARLAAIEPPPVSEKGDGQGDGESDGIEMVWGQSPEGVIYPEGARRPPADLLQGIALDRERRVVGYVLLATGGLSHLMGVHGEDLGLEGDDSIESTQNPLLDGDDYIEIAKDVRHGEFKAAGVSVVAAALPFFTAAEIKQWLRIKKLPIQGHHLGTNKGAGPFAKRFSKIVRKFGLESKEMWNLVWLPHLGRHPPEYHRWVIRETKRAAKKAKTKEQFLRLFDEYVAKPVLANPMMLRAEYWRRVR